MTLGCISIEVTWLADDLRGEYLLVPARLGHQHAECVDELVCRSLSSAAVRLSMSNRQAWDASRPSNTCFYASFRVLAPCFACGGQHCWWVASFMKLWVNRPKEFVLAASQEKHSFTHQGHVWPSRHAVLIATRLLYAHHPHVKLSCSFRRESASASHHKASMQLQGR